MAGSPVTSENFAILNVGGDECTLMRSLLATNERLNNFFEWFLDEDGVPTDEFLLTLSYRLIPIGGMIPWVGGTSLPTGAEGWLLCAGQAVSRTTYATLYALIGTTFGAGDGSTTFNVPDTRDRTLVGAGTTYTVGQQFGAASATLSTTNLPEHSHTITSVKQDEVELSGGAAARFEILAIYANTTNDPYVGAGDTPSTYETEMSGEASPEAVATIPPSLGARYIIKAL